MSVLKQSRAELQRCLATDHLHLVLLPTEACNFRCVYCYESFALKRMEPWVVASVKRFLDARWDRLRTLTVSWFGGEPLLAEDIIEEVQAHIAAKQVAGRRVALESDVTTNASLLTPEMAGRLGAAGIGSYQVTLDGPRAQHDRKRVLPGGKGTFDRIWGNLEALAATGLEFRMVVRVHLDRENLESLDEFLDAYRRSFGSDSRFELFLRGLSRLGGPNDASLRILDGEEGARALQAARDRAASSGLRLTSIRPADDICYASRANSFVIRADGRLNKCTVGLEHPANQVGRLRPDGTLELEQPRLRVWLRGIDTGDREALRCPMRAIRMEAAS